MPTESISTARYRTMGDVLTRLGGIPADRVLLTPPPGTATERDLVVLHDRGNRLCELIDGVLVQKTAEVKESISAAYLGYHLISYLQTNSIGQALGVDGPFRLFPGMVRLPDASFISWARLSKARKAAILAVAPDLAAEILSKGNSKREMRRKLDDYFEAGVRLVWYVDIRKRTVQVYTEPGRSVTLGEDDTLDGGDVLPGFRLALREWFDEGLWPDGTEA
jgi:Uma2 family endonuclease